MATIREIIHGRVVHSAEAHHTVLETARFMVAHNIGAVPVLENGELAGIFSERDLMRRVMVEGRDAARTSIGEVMTRNPLVVSAEDNAGHCLLLMKQHGFRHLPVCDEERKLRGFLSLRDLLLREIDEKHDEARLMREYMHSSPPGTD